MDGSAPVREQLPSLQRSRGAIASAVRPNIEKDMTMGHKRWAPTVSWPRATHAVGMAAFLTMAATSAMGGEEPSLAPSSAPEAAKQKPAVASGGMTIYVDPNTGAFLPGPAPGAEALALSPAEVNAMSTSHEGLVEVPGTSPGGGMKVDLQGRFQSTLMATVGPDGKVRVQHLGLPAPNAAAKPDEAKPADAKSDAAK